MKIKRIIKINSFNFIRRLTILGSTTSRIYKTRNVPIRSKGRFTQRHIIQSNTKKSTRINPNKQHVCETYSDSTKKLRKQQELAQKKNRCAKLTVIPPKNLCKHQGSFVISTRSNTEAEQHSNARNHLRL